MIPRYPASTAVEVTTTLDAGTRDAWRAWLAAHHATDREIWLLLRRGILIEQMGELQAIDLRIHDIGSGVDTFISLRICRVADSD